MLCRRKERGIDNLSVYLLYGDNIRRRGGEDTHLMHLAETVIPEKALSRRGHWRRHVAGDISLLPPPRWPRRSRDP